MGRPAKGLRVRAKRGWAYAHFTWDSYEYRIALRIWIGKGATAEQKRAASDAAARAHAHPANHGQRRTPALSGVLQQKRHHDTWQKQPFAVHGEAQGQGGAGDDELGEIGRAHV